VFLLKDRVEVNRGNKPQKEVLKVITSLQTTYLGEYVEGEYAWGSMLWG
jgi:hypothetical protein